MICVAVANQKGGVGKTTTANQRCNCSCRNRLASIAYRSRSSGQRFDGLGRESQRTRQIELRIANGRLYVGPGCRRNESAKARLGRRNGRSVGCGSGDGWISGPYPSSREYAERRAPRPLGHLPYRLSSIARSADHQRDGCRAVASGAPTMRVFCARRPVATFANDRTDSGKIQSVAFHFGCSADDVRPKESLDRAGRPGRSRLPWQCCLSNCNTAQRPLIGSAKPWASGAGL